MVGDAAAPAEARELVVEEGDVEGRVVDHELGAGDEGEELVRHLGETRMLAQELEAEPVHLERTLVDLALRIEIALEAAPGAAALAQFDAADFHQPVPAAGFESGGFGIEHDLAHASAPLAPAPGMAARAAWSTSSFSTWPEWPRTQTHSTAWAALTASSRSHRSRFRTGWRSAVRHPAAFQRGTHSVIPRWTYCESVDRRTRLGRVSAASPSIAAVNSMRLLVVSPTPPDSRRSLSRQRSSAAQPPGPGLPVQAPSV